MEASELVAEAAAQTGGQVGVVAYCHSIGDVALFVDCRMRRQAAAAAA